MSAPRDAEGASAVITVRIVAPLRDCPRYMAVIEKLRGFGVTGTHAIPADVELDMKRPPAAFLIGEGIADADAVAFVERVRAAPATRESRVVVMRAIEDAETARAALLRAGADDVVWLPAQADAMPEKLRGVEESEFRRMPRVPCAATVKLTFGSETRELQSESLSHLGMRVHWREPDPGPQVGSISMHLPGARARTLWCKVEDFATLSGRPHGLVLRFVALTPQERAELAAVVAHSDAPRLAPPPSPEDVGLVEESTDYGLALPRPDAQTRGLRPAIAATITAAAVVAVVAVVTLLRN